MRPSGIVPAPRSQPLELVGRDVPRSSSTRGCLGAPEIVGAVAYLSLTRRWCGVEWRPMRTWLRRNRFLLAALAIAALADAATFALGNPAKVAHVEVNLLARSLGPNLLGAVLPKLAGGAILTACAVGVVWLDRRRFATGLLVAAVAVCAFGAVSNVLWAW